MIAGQLELQLIGDVARLRTDVTQMNRIVSSGAHSMQKALDEVSNSLKGIFGGVSAGAFAAWIKGTIDFQDELNDLNKTTGIAIEKLAGLSLMSKQTGSDLTGVAQSINKLTMEMGKDAEKFRRIGITAKDPLEAFKQLSEVFRAIEDPQLRAAVAAEALGKSWTAAAPALSEGAEAIDAMVRRGEELAGITERDAKMADEFNDALSELQLAFKGTSSNLAGDLLPLMTELVKSLTEVTHETNQTDGGFSILTETMRAIIVIGGNVAFVIHGIAKEIGILAAQAVAVSQGEFARAAEIGRMARADAADARAKFDAWETRMMTAGQNVAGSVREVDREWRRMQESASGARQAGLRAFVDGDKAGKAAAASAKKLADEREKELQERVKWGRSEVLRQYDESVAIAAAEKKALDESIAAWHRLNDAKVKALKSAAELLESMQFEAAAIGMTNIKREKAIALRALEQTGLDKSSEKFKELAIAIAAAVEQREATREAIDMWRSIDQTAHQTFVNIFDSGSNVFKKLGETLKASVLDLLYQMTVRKWIISIGASVGLPGAALASPSLGGGGSMLGGLFSGVGSLGSFGSGMGAGFSALFGEAGISGAMSAGSVAMGAGNIMGGLGTVVGALGPIAAGLAAVYMIAQKFKGETRSGGQYNFGGLIAGPSGGEIGSGTAGQMAKTTADTINATLAALGSSSVLTNFMSGLESSENGKGFAYAGGTLSTGGAFGQGWGAAFAQDGFNNRRGDMTPEEALAAFTEELKQATLQAIQAATDVPEAVLRLVRGKDFDAMAADELDAVLSQIDAVVTAVNSLDGALINLPFATLTERSFDLKSALIEAAGGVDALVGKLNFVFGAFYSEEEQRQQTVRNIQRVLGAAGGDFTEAQITGASREQFRQMLDYWGGRADPFGQQLFNGLLDVAQAFDALHPVVEQTGEVIEEVIAVVRDVVQDAMTALEQAAQRERQALEAQRQAAQQRATEIAAIIRLTEQASRQLYGQVEATRLLGGRQGAAFIAQALSTARNTGYLPESGALDQAIQSAVGGLGHAGQSKLDADFERLVLAGQLQALAVIGGPQLTEAERAVRLAEEQLERLDDQLEYWRQAVEIAQGQLDVTMSWGEALGRMAAAFEQRFGATAAGGASFGGTTVAASGGGAVFGAGSTTPEGLRYTLTSMGIPIPAYDGGTSMVNGNQLALLHDQEAVLNPQEAREYRAGGGDEMLAELRDMNQRLWRLEKQATRTANAVNGLGEAPMVVETT